MLPEFPLDDELLDDELFDDELLAPLAATSWACSTVDDVVVSLRDTFVPLLHGLATARAGKDNPTSTSSERIIKLHSQCSPFYSKSRATCKEAPDQRINPLFGQIQLKIGAYRPQIWIQNSPLKCPT